MRVCGPGRHGFWFVACANCGIIGRSMAVECPPIPTEDRKPVRRRACPAYREMRQAGASDQEPHEAVVQQVLPLLSWKEASAEAVNAIAYAAKYHSR
jgi:hypothetical protein